MARRLRLEFPAAIYHIINRGNYRRDVFETPEAASTFEAAIAAACNASDGSLPGVLTQSFLTCNGLTPWVWPQR